MFTVLTVQPGSYYSPLAAEFQGHVQRSVKGKESVHSATMGDYMRVLRRLAAATSRFEYASNVVSQSLKASPAPWFWTGSATGVIRFIDTFFPRTIFVRSRVSSFPSTPPSEKNDTDLSVH